MIIKVSTYDNDTFNNTAVGEWLDCRFDADGEPIFVELKKEAGETVFDFIDRCLAVALDNFDEEELTFEGIVDGTTAETLGYDTY